MVTFSVNIWNCIQVPCYNLLHVATVAAPRVMEWSLRTVRHVMTLRCAQWCCSGFLVSTVANLRVSCVVYVELLSGKGYCSNPCALFTLISPAKRWLVVRFCRSSDQLPLTRDAWAGHFTLGKLCPGLRLKYTALHSWNTKPGASISSGKSQLPPK